MLILLWLLLRLKWSLRVLLRLAIRRLVEALSWCILPSRRRRASITDLMKLRGVVGIKLLVLIVRRLGRG